MGIIVKKINRWNYNITIFPCD